MQSMEQAKKAMQQQGVTFAAVSADGVLHCSTKKGIAPIMELLQENAAFLEQAVVADRVIGRAAALLLVKGGIAQLYAEVVSEHAVAALAEHGVPFAYGKRVPYIINRNRNGMCPMEETVLDITDAETAYAALLKKQAALMGKK